MNEEVNKSDRRFNRSDNRTMAAHFLLQKLADDFGLKAFSIHTDGESSSDEAQAVQNFRVEGEEMYLTATGEPGAMRELGIYRAIMGIRRIWRELDALPT